MSMCPLSFNETRPVGLFLSFRDGENDVSYKHFVNCLGFVLENAGYAECMQRMNMHK